MPQKSGFSLAELLVALLILGQISVFTIPKVLQAQQNAEMKSILKETVAMLSQVAYHGALMGEFNSNTDVSSYFAGKINYVTHCPGVSNTQGCWDNPVQGSWGQQGQAGGFVLHNDAFIAGMGTAAANPRPNNSVPGEMHSGFALDLNGKESPNLRGVDQFDVQICLGPSPCNTSLTSPGAKAPGTVSSNDPEFLNYFQ